MSFDRIYIAKDGKSGKHVLVRILAIDDIGANYPPVDSNAFNELMMARDAKSLVLAAQGLGPMFAAKDDLAGRIFMPGELQQGIVREMNLVPSDLGSLLSECYFDPYAEPTGTDGVGYREIGRTGKKAARDLISIVLRIGGLYRTGADPKTILESARFRKVEPSDLKDRFDMGPGACFAIPVAYNPFYRTDILSIADAPLDIRSAWPLYANLVDIGKPSKQVAISHHLKGEGNEFVRFLTLSGGSIDRKGRPEENRWCYLAVSSDIDSKPVKDQMQIANRLLQAIDGRLFQPQIAYSGVKNSPRASTPHRYIWRYPTRSVRARSYPCTPIQKIGTLVPKMVGPPGRDAARRPIGFPNGKPVTSSAAWSASACPNRSS